MNTDAVEISNNAVPKGMSAVIPFELMQEISKNLKPNDIKKLYFLCLDLIPPGTQCPKTIQELLSCINCDVDIVELMKELLYHIKKYRLLKNTLQSCRHKMEIILQDKKFVKEDRVSLFYICENLEKDSVKELKCRLNMSPHVTKDWEDVAAEDFLSVWLRDIDLKKIQQLKQKLQEMRQDQLVAKLNCEGLPYNVVTPSPGRPCGLAVVFNNEEFNKSVSQEYKSKPRVHYLKKRDGTKIDQDNLIKLWRNFGFDIVIFNDTTYSWMMKILAQLLSLSYSSYSMFICCILSHGDRDSIYTSDNIAVNICEEIVYKFNSNKVPDLNGKPKIFFIQACQGKNAQIVKIPSDSSLQMDTVGYSTNSMRDMVWVISAIPSFKSFRDPLNGSWFINSIVDIFREYGTTYDVLRLLNLVNNDVSRKIGHCEDEGGNVTQMPAFSATTFGILYLKRIENDSMPFLSVQHLQYCPQHLQMLYNFANAIYPL